MKKLICCFLSAITTFATVITLTLSTSAWQRSTVFSIEAFTVGGGYILRPVLIDTAWDFGYTTFSNKLTEIFDEYNIEVNYGNGIGDSIDSIAIDTSNLEIHPDIKTALEKENIDTGEFTSGQLNAGSITEEARWILIVENQIITENIEDYILPDGHDCIVRIVYSTYGFGADIGIDNSAFTEYGAREPIIPITNRDSVLFSTSHYYVYDSDDSWERMKAKTPSIYDRLVDLNITQEKIDSLEANFVALKDSPNTGVSDVAFAFGVAVIALATIVIVKKQKTDTRYNPVL